MPRALWTGTISFGLVNIPVRLYPATRKKGVRFHELDRFTGARVHHQRVTNAGPPRVAATEPAERSAPAPASAEPKVLHLPGPEPMTRSEVAFADVVKGFEIEPNRYVEVTREELEAMEPERRRSIEIEQFVDVSEVDPIYFDTSYYAVPQPGLERAFELLVLAMAKTRKLAASWVVLRRRRHLAVLRPYRGVLLLTTMHFADEVLELPYPAQRQAEVPPARELDTAQRLLKAMTEPFQPERYRDEYRERVLELIESRAGSARLAPEEEGPPLATGLEDLMAALERSLATARARKRDARAAPAERSRAKKR